MSSTARIDQSATMEQNIAYYNEVADLYNSIIDGDQANGFIRSTVREKFVSLLPCGTVLDFGGGTGLDLAWLTEGGYNVFFCEPSAGMRKQAKQSIIDHPLSDSVVFMDDTQTDFTKWTSSSPFEKRVDGILCNFGVLNYIPDIHALFNSFAQVIRPGGHFVAIMLELGFTKRWKWHRRYAAQSFLFRHTFKMHIPYKTHTQTVFVHTLKEIKKASNRHFTFEECNSLNVRDFTLIHLVRNEKYC